MCGMPPCNATTDLERERQRHAAIALSPIFAAVEYKGRWLPVYEGRTNIPRVDRRVP